MPTQLALFQQKRPHTNYAVRRTYVTRRMVTLEVTFGTTSMGRVSETHLRHRRQQWEQETYQQYT
jgi:hypothetical protein